MAARKVRGRHRSPEPVATVEFSLVDIGHEIVHVKDQILYGTCAIFLWIN